MNEVLLRDLPVTREENVERKKTKKRVKWVTKDEEGQRSNREEEAGGTVFSLLAQPPTAQQGV